MKTKRMIDQNRELQEQLNTDNKEYYEKLLVYVRTHSLMKEANKVEEVLLEILQDILVAQNKNISAEEYFGHEPKETADELLKQISYSLKDVLMLALYAFGVYASISVLSQLTLPGEGLDLGKLGIMGLYAVVFAFVVVWLLGKSMYSVSGKIGKWLFPCLFGLGIVLGIGMSLVVNTSLRIYLDGFVGIVSILIMLAILAFFFLREEEKQAWLPFLPVVSTSVIVGILTRIPGVQLWMNSSNGRVFTVIFLLAAILVQYGYIYILNKKMKRN